MGDIQEALGTFQKMMAYKYKFVVSHKKTAYDFELNLEEKDFRHMAGLHYLNDIDIPKAPKTLFEKIKNEKINDEYLNGSSVIRQIKQSGCKLSNPQYAQNDQNNDIVGFMIDNGIINIIDVQNSMENMKREELFI